MDWRSGDKVADWTLAEFEGQGGNGEVWKAQRDDGTLVALKILRQRRPDSEPFQRFRDEIHILRKLGNYPGILPIIDADLPEKPSRKSPAWLATPLAVLIRSALGESPTLQQVVEAVRDVATTLAKLQEEHGIYHRDIKPQNLYRLGDQWCVGDFGLVDYPDKAALTVEGRWVGPMFYLSDELLIDAKKAARGPADVFALAKTLWVLATGQHYPLQGHLSRTQTAFRVSTYFADRRATLIDKLIDEATQHDPQSRPTMRQIANELQAWLNTPAISTTIPAFHEKASRLVVPAKRSITYSTPSAPA